MDLEDNAEGSTWRWAWRRTRARIRGIVLAALVIPIGAAILGVLTGPSNGSSVLDHVWWAVWPFVAALFLVGLATGLVSLYSASFEQRRVLSEESTKQRALIAQFESKWAFEPVNTEHGATIKGILENAMQSAENGVQIPFKASSDKSVIVNHFSELGPLLDEWDHLAYEGEMRRRQLQDRFESTMNTLALGSPFAREAFDRFLNEAKRRAREQTLNLPFVIAWRDEGDEDDIHFPNLVMTQDGMGVAEVNPTEMALTRPAIRMRTQQFVNQMMDWNELREYGDLVKIREYEKCQRDLLSSLKFRVEQDGYLRGSGCPRCPHT